MISSIAEVRLWLRVIISNNRYFVVFTAQDDHFDLFQCQTHVRVHQRFGSVDEVLTAQLNGAF